MILLVKSSSTIIFLELTPSNWTHKPQGQLDSFVQQFNSQTKEDRVAQTGGPGFPRQAKVVGLDPFRHLGRNDRIKVKDIHTGEVQDGVKFKNAEKRLRIGDLELL
jgi:hypothetical protein